MTDDEQELLTVNLRRVGIQNIAAMVCAVLSLAGYLWHLDGRIREIELGARSRIEAHEMRENEILKSYDRQLSELEKKNDGLMEAIGKLSDKIDKILERLSK